MHLNLVRIASFLSYVLVGLQIHYFIFLPSAKAEDKIKMQFNTDEFRIQFENYMSPIIAEYEHARSVYSHYRTRFIDLHCDRHEAASCVTAEDERNLRFFPAEYQSARAIINAADQGLRAGVNLCSMVHNPEGNFLERLKVAARNNCDFDQPRRICHDSVGHLQTLDNDLIALFDSARRKLEPVTTPAGELKENRIGSSLKKELDKVHGSFFTRLQTMKFPVPVLPKRCSWLNRPRWVLCKVL